MTIPSKELFQDLYWNQELSQSDIDKKFQKYRGFSHYWMPHFGILRRTRAEGAHLKHCGPSEAGRKRISQALKGLKRSTETRLKISTVKRKYAYTPPNKEILYELYVNQHLSVREIAKKLGLPGHGIVLTHLAIHGIHIRTLIEASHYRHQKYINPRKGKHPTPETLKKLSEARKGKFLSRKEIICMNCHKSFFIPRHEKRLFCSRVCSSENKRGKPNPWSMDARHKQSERRKGMKFSESHRKHLAEHRKNQKIPKCFTKPELKFMLVSEKLHLPFKYTGNGKLWIENLNPDFSHNEKKIAIDIFGDYWHSPLLRGPIRKEQQFQFRIDYAKKRGWKLIIFWESELKSSNVEQIILKRLTNERIL